MTLHDSGTSFTPRIVQRYLVVANAANQDYDLG